MSSPWDVQRLPSATERRNAGRRALAARKRAEAAAERVRRAGLSTATLCGSDAHRRQIDTLRDSGAFRGCEQGRDIP